MREERKVNIYGTIGPACLDVDILRQMFQAGMTGMRLNLSHISLKDASQMIDLYHRASTEAGMTSPDLLIDMQGPELRIGNLSKPVMLESGDKVCLSPRGIPVPDEIFPCLSPGQSILMDDGKILLEVIDEIPDEPATVGSDIPAWLCTVLRGGKLESRKSIALPGKEIRTPVLTRQDIENLRLAPEYGVTGIMQPFVRSREDLLEVREVMEESGCAHLSLLAKIENMSGVRRISDYLDLADEIVIARGDLGNSMPLWELPRVQKEISEICSKAHVPFMVVTQMLASMETCPVPTRAEVSDIFHAVTDGASSIMVTGETAVGEYPVEVIRYLSNTAQQALDYMQKNK